MKDHSRYELRYEHRTGTAPAYRYYNRSIYLPSVEDPTHYELILELTDQFQNQLNHGVLQNLNGTQRCIDFRNCLHSTTLTAWDEANAGQPQTDANWNASLTRFLAKIFKPNAFISLKSHLGQIKKPFDLDCEQLKIRLKHINNLSSWLPEAPDVMFPYTPLDDKQLRLAYHSLMLPQWQSTFNISHPNLLHQDGVHLDTMVQSYHAIETEYNLQRNAQ